MADTPADPVDALADKAPRWGIEMDRLRSSVAARLGIDSAPLRAGRFVLGERLGAGGLGVVYAADDPDLQRRVAVKVLKQAGTTRAAQRLTREAQAMAAFSHPNVVPVFDVGTADLGSGPVLFIAMELVRGSDLRRWLADEPRDWRTILDVFVQAGRGLAAAHRAGLVHRDFKPDNVLVGDDGRVRVADFGLARAMLASDGSQPEVVEHDRERPGTPSPASPLTTPLTSPLTTVGSRLGTPAYMAPEQHAGTADAASDQFGFCVALYEALYRHRPFEGDTADALARAVRHGPPSSRPESDTSPARLHAIITRGLAVEPTRRWASMDDLVKALESVARPRRRALVALLAVAGAGLIVALVESPTDAVAEPCAAGGGLAPGLWDRSAKAELRDRFAATMPEVGTRQYEAVAPVLDTAVQRWDETHAAVCRASASPEREAALACLDRARTLVRARLAALGVASETVVRHATQALRGLPDPSRCAMDNTPTDLLPRPSDPTLTQTVAELRLEIHTARAHRITGELDRALQVAEAAYARAQTVDFAPTQVEAQHTLGWLQREANDLEHARDNLRAAFWTAQEIGHDVVAADAAADMIVIEGLDRMQQAEGQTWVRHAESVVARLPVSSRSTARVHQNAATFYLQWRRPEAAAAHLRSVLDGYDALGSAPDPRRASALTNLASVTSVLQGPEAAVPLYRQALAEYEGSVGAHHRDTALVLSNLANVLGATDPERIAVAQRAAEIFETTADNHRLTALARHNLGIAYRDGGDLDNAESALRRALAIKQGLAERSDPDIAVTQAQLALVLAERGRIDEARDEYGAAAHRIEDVPEFGPEHEDWVPLQRALGDTCRLTGERAEAAEHYAGALAALEGRDDAEARHLAGVLAEARDAVSP